MTPATGFLLGTLGVFAVWLAVSLTVLSARAIRNHVRVERRLRYQPPQVKATITSAKPIARPITANSAVRVISTNPRVVDLTAFLPARQ